YARPVFKLSSKPSSQTNCAWLCPELAGDSPPGSSSEGGRVMTNARSNFRRAAATLLVAGALCGVIPRLIAAGTALGSGQSLGPGDSLTSPSGAFTLVYQTDGNLVVYQQDGTPIWWTGTDGTDPGAVTLQADGNVVLTDASGDVLWTSGTDGNAGASLMMQDSGALQVIASNGGVLFDSGSGGGSTGDCGGFGGGSTLASGQVLCTNSAVTSPS